MSVVTVMPREPEWTVDDLDRLPDDGLQYELLDGLLLVSPAPVASHQRAAGNLFVLLRARCPDDLEVFFAPLDWRPDRRTSLQPDLLVVRRADVTDRPIDVPLRLAVEVLSPTTRRKDLVLKRSKYEDAGVASYWVVDPGTSDAPPSLVAWDLHDGRYVEVARVSGEAPATLSEPFPVTVVPAALTR